MSYPITARADSPAWQWFVKVSFTLALGAQLAGVALAPVDIWVRGYLVMGTLFLVGSTLMLAKSVRDQWEAERVTRS